MGTGAATAQVRSLLLMCGRPALLLWLPQSFQNSREKPGLWESRGAQQ